MGFVNSQRYGLTFVTSASNKMLEEVPRTRPLHISDSVNLMSNDPGAHRHLSMKGNRGAGTHVAPFSVSTWRRVASRTVDVQEKTRGPRGSQLPGCLSC